MKIYISDRVLDEKSRKKWFEAEPPANIWPGKTHPLGTHYDGQGTNFSIFSEVAEKVELCLFDEEDRERRIRLTEVDGHIWHVYLPGIRPGQRYGYRVYGPWDPQNGHRCNPNKLLMDPYAKAIEGQVKWNRACFDYEWGDENKQSKEDSAPFMPRSVVHDPFFDWAGDRPPAIPLHKTIIYELHVKGMTKLHPGIAPELRGTYAGLVEPPTINHLKRLGVTTVELMPVHQFVHDGHLLDKGLRNYWGYNSIGYLAPHNEYSSSGQRGQQVTEFKAMVKRLHEAGIEVILDVVYNHTAEGNHLGPTLSLKGIDNAAYYRLVEEDRRYYFDTTGTGNSFNMGHPHALQLIMDSLRYWITEMHVDGFRFDLASTLARELYEVDRLSAFFQLVHQDPIIGQVKLIAEPWDLGEGGYQVGNFPPQWSEWNGHYRDTVRDFWRGEEARLSELASRFTGSSDLYQGDTRRPIASINFITAHDGFTLHDLVAYNEKHNEANLEDNNDGESENRSWNCGAEGPTDDPAIEELRFRQKLNFLTTLFLSQGVPMLLHGDEFGRSQQGNNNAYCQDNELAWLNWEISKRDEEQLEFTEQIIELRKKHPIFRRRRWFQGRPIHGTEDIGWYKPDGSSMEESDWATGFAKSIGIFLNGEGLSSLDETGRPVRDDSFFLIFNAHSEPIEWRLPQNHMTSKWEIALYTAKPLDELEKLAINPLEPFHVAERSSLLLARLDD